MASIATTGPDRGRGAKVKRRKPKPLKGHGHELSRAAERLQRIDTRQRLAESRAELQATRAARAAAVVQIRSQVSAARRALPARLKTWRTINREIMRAAVRGERQAVKAANVEAKSGTKERAALLYQAAQRKIDAELGKLRWLGHRREHEKAPARVKAALRAAELRSEADDFVKDELPAQFHAAWDELKHKIKARKNAARWEVALEFFSEHGALVAEANARRAARELAAELGDEQRAWEDAHAGTPEGAEWARTKAKQAKAAKPAKAARAAKAAKPEDARRLALDARAQKAAKDGAEYRARLKQQGIDQRNEDRAIDAALAVLKLPKRERVEIWQDVASGSVDEMIARVPSPSATAAQGAAWAELVNWARHFAAVIAKAAKPAKAARAAKAAQAERSTYEPAIKKLKADHAARELKEAKWRAASRAEPSIDVAALRALGPAAARSTGELVQEDDDEERVTAAIERIRNPPLGSKAVAAVRFAVRVGDVLELKRLEDAQRPIINYRDKEIEQARAAWLELQHIAAPVPF